MSNRLPSPIDGMPIVAAELDQRQQLRAARRSIRAVLASSVASAARTSGRRRSTSAGASKPAQRGRRRAPSGRVLAAAAARGPAARRSASRSHWRSPRGCFRAAGCSPRSAARWVRACSTSRLETSPAWTRQRAICRFSSWIGERVARDGQLQRGRAGLDRRQRDLPGDQPLQVGERIAGGGEVGLARPRRPSRSGRTGRLSQLASAPSVELQSSSGNESPTFAARRGR